MLQLATPNLAGFTKSYIAPPVPVTYVGKRVEADYFEAEFNEEVVIDRINKANSCQEITNWHGALLQLYPHVAAAPTTSLLPC